MLSANCDIEELSAYYYCCTYKEIWRSSLSHLNFSSRPFSFSSSSLGYFIPPPSPSSSVSHHSNNEKDKHFAAGVSAIRTGLLSRCPGRLWNAQLFRRRICCPAVRSSRQVWQHPAVLPAWSSHDSPGTLLGKILKQFESGPSLGTTTCAKNQFFSNLAPCQVSLLVFSNAVASLLCVCSCSVVGTSTLTWMSWRTLQGLHSLLNPSPTSFGQSSCSSRRCRGWTWRERRRSCRSLRRSSKLRPAAWPALMTISSSACLMSRRTKLQNTENRKSFLDYRLFLPKCRDEICRSPL